MQLQRTVQLIWKRNCVIGPALWRAPSAAYSFRGPQLAYWAQPLRHLRTSSTTFLAPCTDTSAARHLPHRYQRSFVLLWWMAQVSGCLRVRVCRAARADRRSVDGAAIYMSACWMPSTERFFGVYCVSSRYHYEERARPRPSLPRGSIADQSLSDPLYRLGQHAQGIVGGGKVARWDDSQLGS